MRRVNEANERVKRDYAIYLRNAKGQDETSVDKVLAALVRFEECTKFKSFRQFRIQKAVDFKDHLACTKNARTGRPLGGTTIDAELRLVKRTQLPLQTSQSASSRPRLPLMGM